MPMFGDQPVELGISGHEPQVLQQLQRGHLNLPFEAIGMGIAPMGAVFVGDQIVIGIMDGVSDPARADHQITGRTLAPVFKAMAHRNARRPSRAIAGGQRCFRVFDQHEMA